MIDSINIKGFRKYKALELTGFSNVNFILGDNNIGKTTILEAIYTWACGQNISPMINIPVSRARYMGLQMPYWMMEEVLSCVYDRKQIPLSFEISAREDGENITFNHTINPSELLTLYDASYKKFDMLALQSFNEQTGGLGHSSLSPIVVAKWTVNDGQTVVESYVTSPTTQTATTKSYKFAKYIDLLSQISVGECVTIYSSLKRENRLEQVVEELKTIYPEVVDIDMIPYPDGSQAPISVKKDDGSILPLYAFGDGLQRWFYILGVINLHKNSIICIDEIDTGFHPRGQKQFCKLLADYTIKNGVQLFITTHNIEFVRNYLETSEANDKSSVYTLKNVNGEIKVRNKTGDEAKELLDYYNLDLR